MNNNVAKRLWKTKYLLLPAAVFYVLSLIAAKPFFGVPKDEREWYHDAVELVLVQADLSALSFWLFIAAIAYFFAISLFDEHIKPLFESGVSTISRDVSLGYDKIANSIGAVAGNIKPELVEHYIETTSLKQEELYGILESSLFKYYQADTPNKSDLIKFVLDNLLDGSASKDGPIRNNLRIDTRLRFRNVQPIENSESIEKCHEWNEERTYVLHCPSGSAPHTFYIDTEFEASSEIATKFIREGNYTLAAGSLGAEKQEILNLRKSLDNAGITDLLVGDDLTVDSFHVSYDGNWIKIKCKEEYSLQSIDTDIMQTEKNFTSSMDNFFFIVVKEPVRDFSFSMSLLDGYDGWKLNDPNFSADYYHSEAQGSAVINRRSDKEISVNVRRWSLPGILFVIDWAPGN